MLLQRPQRPANHARRGSALMMAFLMIILLFGIVFQLWLSTNVDLRVADNEVTHTQMDLAIESALQEVYDRLKTDGETAAASQGGGADPTAAAAGGEGGEEPPSDSREDAWGKPQRTSINEIDLRIVVQDEDSKINVLGILTEDPDMADEHLERLVRVIDEFREGSTLDIDRTEAARMADEIRRHLRERTQSVLPKPALLSDDDADPDLSLPLSVREFVVLEGFDDSLFRDGRDERGYVVHSLGAFLTVWTALTTQSTETGEGVPPVEVESPEPPEPPPSAEGQGGETTGGAGGGGSGDGANFGVAVNINTAPAAVLKALFDDRDVTPRFWDSVIEYRNLEDLEKRDQSQEEQGTTEPVLDEYGNEVIVRQIFDSVDELSEVESYDLLDAEARGMLTQFVCTQSQVFSIYVTAYRRPKGDVEMSEMLEPGAAADKELSGLRWRTVRSVVWRYTQGDQIKIIPLVRWELLDYVPIEVIDYPDSNR